jgi:hypothetical protein
MRNTTNDLIAQVKRIESIPANQTTFTDQDIIELMDMELHSSVVPWFLKIGEEFLVSYQDYPVGSNSIITLPSTAIAMRIRDIVFMNENGDRANIPRLSPEMIGGTVFGQPRVYGFYLESNKIKFYPENASPARTVRVSFYKRANHLNLVSYSGRILHMDAPSYTITLDNAPSDTIWTNGTVLDAIGPSQPHDFTCEGFPIVNRALGSFDLIVSPAAFALLSVGDIIATSGEAPVCQYIPEEALWLLVQGTAMRCLEALGDRPGWDNAAKKYARMEQDLLAMISPRTDGEPKKIVAKSGLWKVGRTRNVTNWNW